ncbi:hypothetical protein X975_10317, partial [Stegodyphus mimosarum]
MLETCMNLVAFGTFQCRELLNESRNIRIQPEAYNQ